MERFPKSPLVIWKGFYDLIINDRDNFLGVSRKDGITHIVGLEVHVTDLPEVLEVY